MWSWLGGGGSESPSQDEWDPFAENRNVLSPRSKVPVSPAVSAVSSSSASFTTPLRAIPELRDVQSAREFSAFSALIDYNALPSRLPAGVYVSPSSEDERWNGVFCCRSGPYAGGVFKFSLSLANYPLQRPRVAFVNRIFHPLVTPVTGAVDSEVLMPQWLPQRHRVWHVLQALHAVLVAPIETVAVTARQDGKFSVVVDPDRVANIEAFRTMKTDAALFVKLCAACASESSTYFDAVLQGTLENPNGTFELCSLAKTANP